MYIENIKNFDAKAVEQAIQNKEIIEFKDKTIVLASASKTRQDILKRENIEFVKAALDEQKQSEQIIPEFEKVKPAKVSNTIVYPEIPLAQRTNFVIDNDELGYGGAKEKFRKNMEAIRVLKECESEHRLATPEEQKILSEYVG